MGDLLVPGGLFMLLMFLGGDDKPTTPGRYPDRPTPDPQRPGGNDPTKPTEPTKPTDPTKPPPGRIDRPDPAKPDLPSVLDDEYPTVGAFYPVKQGDMLLGNTQQGGIAHRAIAQEVYLRMKARGSSDADALSVASALAASARGKYVGEIQGDRWNDRQYGTFGYGPNAMPSPLTKRAIRLMPLHANNRERMLNGEKPIRSIKLSTIQNAKQGTGTKAPGAPGGNLELLWLPPFDVDRLIDEGTLVVDRFAHPKWLIDLGWIDMSNAPAGTKWGA